MNGSRGRVDAGLRWLVVVSPAVVLLVAVVDWLLGRVRPKDRKAGALGNPHPVHRGAQAARANEKANQPVRPSSRLGMTDRP